MENVVTLDKFKTYISCVIWITLWLEYTKLDTSNRSDIATSNHLEWLPGLSTTRWHCFSGRTKCRSARKFLETWVLMEIMGGQGLLRFSGSNPFFAEYTWLNFIILYNWWAAGHIKIPAVCSSPPCHKPFCSNNEYCISQQGKHS